MATRETRREENQRRFRRGNEALREAVATKVEDEQAVRFLCECADPDCHGSVEVRLTDWESIAAEGGHYVILPGHLRSEGEEVVGSLGPYDIARKPDE